MGQKQLVLITYVVAWGMLMAVLLKGVDKISFIRNLSVRLPENEAGMVAAMVWGEKRMMEGRLVAAMKRAGVWHIAVVSGANVMMVVGGIVNGLAWWWGRKKTIVWGLAVGWWYGMVVGWQGPVVRAMGLATIYYLAQIWGRKFEVKRAVVVVVILVALIDWRMLTTLSWWMSLAAYVGVVSSGWVEGRGWRGRELIKSFWISLWVWPLLTMAVGKIAIWGPVVTVLVMPMVPLVTILGILASFWGQVGIIIFPLVEYIKLVVESFYFGEIYIRFNWLVVVGWYLVLVGFTGRIGKGGNR